MLGPVVAAPRRQSNVWGKRKNYRSGVLLSRAQRKTTSKLQAATISKALVGDTRAADFEDLAKRTVIYICRRKQQKTENHRALLANANK